MCLLVPPGTNSFTSHHHDCTDCDSHTGRYRTRQGERGERQEHLWPPSSSAAGTSALHPDSVEGLNKETGKGTGPQLMINSHWPGRAAHPSPPKPSGFCQALPCDMPARQVASSSPPKGRAATADVDSRFHHGLRSRPHVLSEGGVLRVTTSLTSCSTTARSLLRACISVRLWS